MNKTELVELLAEVAKDDLAEGSDINDHPCSVAIRALDKCFADINFLKRIVDNKSNRKSKAACMILGLSYDPEW